jgi:hypothetical protein
MPMRFPPSVKNVQDHTWSSEIANALADKRPHNGKSSPRLNQRKARCNGEMSQRIGNSKYNLVATVESTFVGSDLVAELSTDYIARDSCSLSMYQPHVNFR